MRLGFIVACSDPRGFPCNLGAQTVKSPPAMWEAQVQFLGWEDSLEKGKATHFSILAWRIPRTVHVQTMGSQKIRHD